MGTLLFKNESHQFAAAWNGYTEIYNELSEILQSKGVDTALLDKVVDSRVELFKACLNVKLDEISKV